MGTEVSVASQQLFLGWPLFWVATLSFTFTIGFLIGWLAGWYFTREPRFSVTAADTALRDNDRQRAR